MRLSRPRMVRPHLSNLHTIIRITILILNIIGPLVCIPHSHLSHYHVIYFGILVNFLTISIQSLSSFTKIGALDTMMYNLLTMYIQTLAKINYYITRSS